MKYINTKNAPAAIGPYSQAIEANGFIFCSGQIGIDPKTGNLVDGIENQTKQAIINLQAVLKAARPGLAASTRPGLAGITKTTVYLKNMADFAKMNVVYASFFGPHKPARSTVEVSNLPKGALIEIEAIALK